MCLFAAMKNVILPPGVHIESFYVIIYLLIQNKMQISSLWSGYQC
jgi:hypothetical protein